MQTANTTRVTRDKDLLQLQYRHALEPRATVAVGETIIVETDDNFALYREMTSDQDLVTDLPLTQLNPLTGPIAVTGAEPGDTLIVEVVDIGVAEQGHIALIAGTGVLKNATNPPHTKIWQIRDGEAIFNDDIRFPIRPILGTFGTMPAEDGLYAIYPGPHGGNLDDTNSVAGAIYHLPVFVPQAMLMVGDVHANQGDSEIAMGIEIDGEVTLRIVDLVKGATIPYARIETADTWVFPADAPTLEDAIQISAAFAARFLCERLGVSMEDAAHILSAVGNVRISQAAFAGYNVTVRTEFPKSLDTRGRLRGYAG
ncbi:MAG: acetamidase/formamidase family protein [Thermomicrobiales bacterium]